MTAMVELRGVSKSFAAVEAVRDVSLRVERGELLTLLGPSGCGKTTLLRLIGGLETPDRGAVLLDGQDVTRLPPYRRDVHQVFQSYALFPHLDVRGNVAFPLRMNGTPRRRIDARIDDALDLVELRGLGARRVHELSGGQRQRVALARALVSRPKVLLLDEPLAALDARLRRSMQSELKRLQQRLGMTFIFVTHDQDEALTLSDRIAVIHDGRIEQLAGGVELYDRPATRFVASFVGECNLLEGAIDGARLRLADGTALRLNAAPERPAGAAATVALRPERIHLARRPIPGDNVFHGAVLEEQFKGPIDRLSIRLDAGAVLSAAVANVGDVAEPFRVGERVFCQLHPDDLVLLRD